MGRQALRLDLSAAARARADRCGRARAHACVWGMNEHKLRHNDQHKLDRRRQARQLSACASLIRMLVCDVTSNGICPACPPPVQATSQTAVAVTRYAPPGKDVLGCS